MKNLHLDFIAQPSRFRFLGWFMLCVGLCAVAAVWTYEHLNTAPRLAALRQELIAQQNALKPPVPVSTMKPDELAAAWKHAQVVSDQLALPWTYLFEAMGKASSENVAFLSIEPDPGKGRVVVIAEARDFDAMLGFFQGLQASPNFEDVALQSHLINNAVPEKPVRFRLSARWLMNP